MTSSVAVGGAHARAERSAERAVVGTARRKRALFSHPRLLAFRRVGVGPATRNARDVQAVASDISWPLEPN